MTNKQQQIPAIRFNGFTDTWEQRKLEQLAQFNPKSSLPDKFEYVDLESVVGTEMISHRTETKDTAPSRAQRLAIQGDVFYQTVRPYQKNNYLFDLPHNNYVFSTGYAQLRPFGDSYYLLSRLQDDKFVFNVLERSTGTSYPAINSSDLAQIEVGVPLVVEEQIKIGDFFKNLDNTIALHQRQLGNYKELKKAMLQKMFPRDGESVPEVRFAGFTESWEQRKFKELFCERREKTVFENEDTLLSCAIEGMFLNTELFSHFRGSSNIGYLKVKKNDLILSAQNLHIGNANVNLRFEHGIISPAYKVYDLINSNPLFIQAWVKKDATKNFFLSATTEGASGCRKNVEWKVLNEQVIAVPNMEEQNKIGEFFKQLDETIALHQQKGTDYQQLKKTMLQQMFV